MRRRIGALACLALAGGACSASSGVGASGGADAGADANANADAVASADAVADTDTDADASADASANPDAPDVSLPADRFVTGVVSFTPGPCAGFGESSMPGVVEGPPVGGGATKGSLDVVSLGVGGEIVLTFAPNAIVDGPGVDFLVFENAFDIGGDPQDPYAEPGEVSVSADGTTWVTFPCTATAYPYGACAGWHPVYSAPGNGISPVDPATAGGDPYDLAAIGVASARYVRIRDKSNETCPDAGGTDSAGFDLDAIAIVNAQIP
jgi:hypothetical protein